MSHNDIIIVHGMYNSMLNAVQTLSCIVTVPNIDLQLNVLYAHGANEWAERGGANCSCSLAI